MKLTRVIIVTLIVALALVSLVGCGTVSIDLHTTVKASGDISQEIKVEGSGMMGAFVTSEDALKDLRKEGWHVSIEHPGACVIATKNFEQGKTVVLPGMEELKNQHFRVRDLVILKEYFFEATIPANPLGIEEDDEFAEVGKAILRSMFSMSWTLTMPGEVIETNADAIDGNSATWYFDIDSLEKERYMMVHSRYINWPLVGGIAGVIVVAGFLIGFIVRRRGYQS